MVTHVDTEPSIVPVVYEFDHTVFTAQNQSITISGLPGNPPILPAGIGIAGVIVQKVIPFDVNSVEIGHGSVAAQRATIATTAEVAATVAGSSRADAWMGPDGIAHAVLGANRNVIARLGAGTVPTAGKIRLVLLTYWPSPRAAL